MIFLDRAGFFSLVSLVIQCVMSWVFVGLRYAHAYIHITSNYVPNRFSTFVAGTLLLIVMWLVFAVRVLFAF